MSSLRQAKFKALGKYADSPAIIVYVQDEEAQILAFDIKRALLQSGWKSVAVMDLRSSGIPLGFIREGVQVRTLQRLAMYGFHIPENGVAVTVGRKPMQNFLLTVPDPAPPEKIGNSQ